MDFLTLRAFVSGLSDVEGLCQWTLTLRAFVRTASGKGGTPRLRPPRQHGVKGYRSFFVFLFNAVIGENEDDNY